MTNPAILEALAARMWKAQAENSGTPASVSLGRTPELFVTQSEETRSSFLRYAAAVLELVGPRPLEFWTSDTGDLICDSLVGRYQIQKGGSRWCCMYAMCSKRRPKGDEAPTFHKSEAAAQAAAQAHADAAHWNNTKLGDML